MKAHATLLSWQGRLSIEEMVPLRKELLAALNEHAEITVDLAAVESLDLACLQLLCSACGSASIRGKRLTLHGIENPALTQTLRMNGLNHRENCLRSRKTSCLWPTKRGNN